MAVKYLPARCWFATSPGGDEHDSGVHYLTEADARKAAADLMADDPLIPVDVGRWPGPCLIAVCDGDCGEQMTDGDEGWLLHLDDWAQVLEAAEAWDWVIDGDQAWCQDDKPDGLTGNLLPPAGMDPLPGMEATSG